MKVSFYATLEPIVGQRNLHVEVLAQRWPGLVEHLFDEDGALSRRVNIFVDGRNVRWLEGLETPLEPEQSVDIFPPVAGG